MEISTPPAQREKAAENRFNGDIDPAHTHRCRATCLGEVREYRVDRGVEGIHWSSSPGVGSDSPLVSPCAQNHQYGHAQGSLSISLELSFRPRQETWVLCISGCPPSSGLCVWASCWTSQHTWWHRLPAHFIGKQTGRRLGDPHVGG